MGDLIIDTSRRIVIKFKEGRTEVEMAGTPPPQAPEVMIAAGLLTRLANRLMDMQEMEQMQAQAMAHGLGDLKGGVR